MKQITSLVFWDIVRNKIVIFYMLLLAAFSWSTFTLEDNSTKGILTLLNIILLVVPLVSILFATIYVYNSTEFIELLLSQPIRRKQIWWSLFLGLSISMVTAFLVGVGIPLFVYAPFDIATMMLSIGSLITLVFIALAFLSSILSRDKAKGIGISILLWLFFALLFDGLVLFLVFQLSEYPIEKMMIGITAFSPLDLARILILLHLDVSAMMGYTGAIFKDFFGTKSGMITAFILLILWGVAPFLVSLRLFHKKDL
ncbi:MAG: ABC transporter permease subunit [Saprospiraceae bacterium]